MWGGIAGICGDTEFGGCNCSGPYRFDVGTGSSDLTWSAMAGLAYEFERGDLMLI